MYVKRAISLNLPGRMVTGLSADAGSMLVNHNDYPQGMTVMSLQVAGWIMPLKQIFTHSFRVMENKRVVETLLPINDFNLDQIKRSLEECQSATDLDAKYQTPSLANDYKCHFNFSFKDLCSTF